MESFLRVRNAILLGHYLMRFLLFAPTKWIGMSVFVPSILNVIQSRISKILFILPNKKFSIIVYGKEF